jgi:hypothetical protein
MCERATEQQRNEFAEALKRLGTESVIPLDEVDATAPTTSTKDHEAGTP